MPKKSTIRGRVVASRFMESAAAVATKRREEREMEGKRHAGTSRPRMTAQPPSQVKGSTSSRSVSKTQAVRDVKTPSRKFEVKMPLGKTPSTRLPAEDRTTHRRTKTPSTNARTPRDYLSASKQKQTPTTDRNPSSVKENSTHNTAKPLSQYKRPPSTRKTPSHRPTPTQKQPVNILTSDEDSALQKSKLGAQLIQWYAVNALFEEKMSLEEEVDCRRMASLWSDICAARETISQIRHDEIHFEAKEKADMYVDIIVPQIANLASALNDIAHLHHTVTDRLITSADQIHLIGVTADPSGITPFLLPSKKKMRAHTHTHKRQTSIAFCSSPDLVLPLPLLPLPPKIKNTNKHRASTRRRSSHPHTENTPLESIH